MELNETQKIKNEILQGENMLREKDMIEEIQSFYTIKDIQRIFNCGRDKAYQITHIRGFPKMVIGRRILIYPDALKKWIQQNYNSSLVL